LTNGLLKSVRVLDLTRVWAGPLATRMLADFGAEVVKIGDPRVPGIRANGTNNKLNRNKLGLALRLDKPAAREIFLALTSVSDVVVENFRPRVMRNFGLTYDVLRGVRPDLIMCSMPGFGTEGAYAEYPAFGPSVETMTGLTSLMGYPGGPPMPSSIAYPDAVAGMNAVSAIMTALWHRRRTGQGQFIDLALSEGPVCQIGEHIVQFSRTGVQPPRVGNTHPDHAPYGCYPAAGEDQWVAVCVTSDEQWSSLRKLMCEPEWAMINELDRGAGRVDHRAKIDDALGAWTSRQEPSELAARLQARGIAAGAVLNNRQLLDDPHLNERGYFVEIDEPELGLKRYPGQAVHLSSDPAGDWTPSPYLGQHTRELLRDLLGLADENIRSLEAKEAIGIWQELVTPT
jgi:crotonobetainyl-CoA:carnitine CoA-transferase CaiB-like acyl-CoA transferase